MLRGLEFLCDPDPFFKTLPSAIDLTAYDWYVDDVEWNYFYFRPGKYTGKEFLASIDDFSSLSFVRIRRFPSGTKEDFMKAQPMEKYEDNFLNGACDLLILFYDGGFTEIYAKDENLTHRMMDVFGKSGVQNLEAKYDHNDVRTEMHY